VPTTAVAGGIWIGTNIDYKDNTGVQKAVANTNTVNTFTANQIIQCTTTSAGLKILNLGTGDAISVEDENSDTTKFVVDQFGKVGIGTAPSATACLKVDANGIMFNDGTVQHTASIQGDEGPTGPAGPAGVDATAWVYKGAYDNGYTYTVGDFVELNGSSYVMISFIGAGGYSPPSGAWQLVASVGAQGPTGNDGSQGQQGNDGGTYPDVQWDNIPYIRRNNAWEPLSSYDQTGGIGDAPNDGYMYARQNGNWVQLP